MEERRRVRPLILSDTGEKWLITTGNDQSLVFTVQQSLGLKMRNKIPSGGEISQCCAGSVQALRLANFKTQLYNDNDLIHLMMYLLNLS